MADFSTETTKDILGSQAVQSVDGTIAGFGVHYALDSNATFNGSTATAELKLDKGSLERAEKASGATPAQSKNTGAEKVLSQADQRQAKADTLYVNSFSEKLQSKVQKGTSSRAASSSRRDYRSAMAMDVVPKSPLQRANRRRLLQLRRTFDQIAKRNTRTVSVSTESMPQEALRKIVDIAIRAGADMTPLGPVAQAVKLVGGKLPTKQQAYNPWKRWEHALFPGSCPEMPRPQEY